LREIKIFVSSPEDALLERKRLDRVVERLNGELRGTAILTTIRWETNFYKAHATFQAQIPEASECEIVIAILRHRLGTELPGDFRRMPNGEPYPSGTAYEVLSAIEASRSRAMPDVYVFRYPEPPTVRLDDPATRAVVEEQWERLKRFFVTWFQGSDGQFKAAFQTFSSTDEFEARAEALLRKWVTDHILKGRSVIWPIEIKGSPFRGLKAFGPRHAPVFFGRSRDISRAVEALKDAREAGTPFLLVVGPSGAGKSSLVRAGLVPRLTAAGVVPEVDVWRTAVMRPAECGGDPFMALAAHMLQTEEIGESAEGSAALPEVAASGYRTPRELADLLRHADAVATKPILHALEKVAQAERVAGGYERDANAGLLLVIDQLDELFSSEVPEATRFVRLLSELLKTGRIWVIATLRADLYEDYVAVPELLALKKSGATYDLQPPGPAELAEIVRMPAHAADLGYEADASGRTLDERLLAEADRADMLPLLQFTLNQLFQERSLVDGKTYLTHAAYDKLGGLDGAIEHEAERALAGLGEAEIARLPRLLRELVVQGKGSEGGQAGAARLTVRSVPFKRAAHDAAAERLIRALVDARILLSTSADAPTIRIAHERVLHSWTRARKIVAENTDFFRIRDEIEDERRRWEAAGRKRDRLIPAGVPLAEAESIGAHFRDELAPEACAFIAASSNRARLRQRLTAGAAVVFLVVAVAAGYLGWLAQERADSERLARVEAQQNFQAAKAAVDGITVQLAEGLRDAAGMRVSTLRNILANVEDSVAQLGRAASENVGLAETRALMLLEFGWTYQAAGDVDAALEAFGEAAAIANDLAKSQPNDPQWQRNLAQALEKIGSIQLRRNRSAEAVAAFEEAAEVDRALLKTHPSPATWENLALSFNGIGDVHRRAGDSAAALASYEESLTIARRLAADDPAQRKWRAELSNVLDRIGDLKLAQGDVNGAVPLYEEGAKLIRDLTQEDPNNSQWRRDLTIALENLGRVRLLQGQRRDAEAAFTEGLQIARSLSALDPDNTQWLRDVSVALDRIGMLDASRGQAADALKAFEEALAIRRRLAEADPANLDWQRDLAAILRRICEVRLSVHELPAARSVCEEALRVARSIAEAEPGNWVSRTELAATLIAAGDLESAFDDLDTAAIHYQAAVDIRRQLLQVDRGNDAVTTALAAALAKLGDARHSMGDLPGARAAFRESAETRRTLLGDGPDLLQQQQALLGTLMNLGDVLLAQGDDVAAGATFTEARDLARRVVEARPDEARDQMNLVISLARVAQLSAGEARQAAAEESLRILDHMAARKMDRPDEARWRELLVSLLPD
jgi:tetratricopeptide (TPR) repeat protein